MLHVSCCTFVLLLEKHLNIKKHPDDPPLRTPPPKIHYVGTLVLENKGEGPPPQIKN